MKARCISKTLKGALSVDITHQGAWQSSSVWHSGNMNRRSGGTCGFQTFYMWCIWRHMVFRHFMCDAFTDTCGFSSVTHVKTFDRLRIWSARVYSLLYMIVWRARSKLITPKNSQENISSSYFKNPCPPTVRLSLFYSPPATVCSWQEANLLQILPEGMDRRSTLYCTIENNNSILLLTNTHGQT